MNDQNRILVVVDPTGPLKQTCVERGALLSKKNGVGLELLICHYDQYLGSQQYMNSPDLAGSRRAIIRRLRTKLEEIATPLRDQGLDVINTAIWDQPLDEGIVRYVSMTNPRMVFKDTHFHNKISRALFTPTDWNLIRDCPAPLWLAKPHAWPSAATILAAVDPLQEHDKPATLDGLILNISETLAKDLACDMHVFHSYVPAAMITANAMSPMPYVTNQVEGNIERHHQRRLNDLLHGRGVAVDGVHMMAGQVHHLLPDLASSIHAGVVVMGAVARTPLKRVFLGSTAEKVLPMLPCDLLVLKAPWFVSGVREAKPEILESDRNTLEPIAAMES